ncbi:hypothetical protein AVEN_228761-1 [Araneus ventricosus]|uniref:Uncharacterized protein n=1 Tax=Araneus ventricosus TaxID=182803 RepID=A0A4Y2TQA2_ARAVE|nr:hypothetical protein AVEN_194077-1 [Araneus ventricosus]GBO02271.1 hypothetical protein AVEN_228761-1 [Araneus ventricosus]
MYETDVFDTPRLRNDEQLKYASRRNVSDHNLNESSRRQLSESYKLIQRNVIRINVSPNANDRTTKDYIEKGNKKTIQKGNLFPLCRLVSEGQRRKNKKEGPNEYSHLSPVLNEKNLYKTEFERFSKKKRE